MQIRDVMTTDVQLTRPDATLAEAARAMADGDFGILPVGDDDRLVGTLTDRDITVRAVAKGTDPMVAKVRDAMSEGVRYCFDDQTTEEAAAMMASNQVRRLPVVNRDKRLVGIVALADIAIDAPQEEAETAVTGVSQ